MIRPDYQPLRGGRWEPFELEIELLGVDLSGATVEMPVRLYRNAPGQPLIALGQVAPPAQGITFAVLDGNSTIRVLINETTMEGLPFSGEPGEDSEFQYDIQVTRPGVHRKARYYR